MRLSISFSALALSLSGLSAHAAPVDVCRRTPEMQRNLEEQLQKKCAAITREDLANISDFTFDLPILNGKIQTFTPRASDFEGLTGLEILNFQDVTLVNVPSRLLAFVPQLKKLGLAAEAKSLRPDSLAGLSNLTELDILADTSQRYDAALFAPLKNLRELTFHSDRLESILPRGGVAQLELLRLNCNRCRLAGDAFSGFSGLRKLRVLAGEGRVTADSGFANGLVRLEELELGGFTNPNENPTVSKIDWPSLASLTALKVLSLPGLNVTFPARPFQSFAALEELNVSSNKIGALTRGFFAGLANLKSLDLHFVDLRTIEAGALGRFTSLSSLDISSNLALPWDQLGSSGVPPLERVKALGIDFSHLGQPFSRMKIGTLEIGETCSMYGWDPQPTSLDGVGTVLLHDEPYCGGS